jgi:cytochrome c-type biogenesis protein CcmE
LPDLFAENQGVVMTGKINNNNVFIADEVLAKHDENYMPPEVADMMKNDNEAPYKK